MGLAKNAMGITMGYSIKDNGYSIKNNGYIYFYKARDYDDEYSHHIGNEDLKFKYN